MISAKKKLAIQILRDMAIAAIATFLVLHVFFRIVVVDGESMQPTLHNGDLLLIQCTKEIQREDIIVCKPDGYDGYLVKRVIGIEGDVVDIDFESGTVSVNGSTLYETYIMEPTHKNMGVEFPLTVSTDHLFLLGDNRNNSHDSRSPDIGQVNRECVIGKLISKI